MSPVLFSLYTSDFDIVSTKCSIIKYADDTVISGYITNDDSLEYTNAVQRFVEWCDLHHLVLNVNKTKEMIYDFRRSAPNQEPLAVHNHVIQQVTEYKYLGTVIDNKLKWSSNTHMLCGKANQRLYFLRKLKEFNVDNRILVLFYRSLIQSILSFSFISNFGNLSKENVHKLERPRKIAQRIIRKDLPSISSLYDKQVLLKVHKIMHDSSHPLHNCFFIQ